MVAAGPGVGLDPPGGRPCLLALGDGEVEDADDRLRWVHLLDHALLLQLRQVRLQPHLVVVCHLVPGWLHRLESLLVPLLDLLDLHQAPLVGGRRSLGDD